MMRIFTRLVLLSLLILRPAIVIGQTTDRIEAAKKEGQLVFFSGVIVQDTQVLLAEFEKRWSVLDSGA